MDGSGWLTPLPDRFTTEKETRYQLHKRLGGPQNQFERVRVISPPPGFDPRTVQPVASHCTACYFETLLTALQYILYHNPQENEALCYVIFSVPLLGFVPFLFHNTVVWHVTLSSNISEESPASIFRVKYVKGSGFLENIDT